MSSAVNVVNGTKLEILIRILLKIDCADLFFVVKSFV